MYGQSASSVSIISETFRKWFETDEDRYVEAKELEKGVVHIRLDALDASRTRVGTHLGTGFVLNDENLIVTNFHVIKLIERDGNGNFLGTVTPALSSEEIPIVEIEWFDEALDLAIIVVERFAGDPVSLSESGIEKGDPVRALGFPGEADSIIRVKESVPTLTSGIVGRVFRGAWGKDRFSKELSVVQHSAAVNSGNSGGPLFDECGRVVAINTGIGRSVVANGNQVNATTGISYASNISELIEILDHRGIQALREDSLCELSTPIPRFVIFFALGAITVISLAIVVLHRKAMRATESVPQIGAVESHAQAPSRLVSTRRVILSLSQISNNGNPLRIDVIDSDLSHGADGFVIGRDHELCHFVVHDPKVSKRQVRIFMRDGRVAVEDLNGANPTKLNGRDLVPFAGVGFKSGDVLLVGDVALGVWLGEAKR